jgi:Tfp pilus assembly protein PilE
MCILPAECKTNTRKRAVTFIELAVILVIIAILATISYANWQTQLNRKRAQNAQIALRMVWQAEQMFFSWHNRYTNVWTDLDVDNPNNTDTHYSYTITGTPGSLTITATQRSGSHGFTIDREGNITSF